MFRLRNSSVLRTSPQRSTWPMRSMAGTILKQFSVLVLTIFLLLVCLAPRKSVAIEKYLPKNIQLNKTNGGQDSLKEDGTNREKSSPQSASTKSVPNPAMNSAIICQRLVKSIHQKLQVLEELLEKLYLGSKDEMPQVVPPSMLTHFDTKSWSLASPSGRKFTVNQLQSIASETALMTVPVPNVAHFVLLPRATTELEDYGRDLQLYELVCLLSCVWIMQPRLIFLWLPAGNVTPAGNNWDYLRRNLSSVGWWESRVVLARRNGIPDVQQATDKLLYEKIRVLELTIKLEAVLTFGGVALSTDALIVKPLNQLRRYYFVIGQDHRKYGLNDGVFLAARGSKLLSIWHAALRRLSISLHDNRAKQKINEEQWRKIEILPSILCHCMPRLCQIESVSLSRPSWSRNEVGWIYRKFQNQRWNWRKLNYVVRLWRGDGVEYGGTLSDWLLASRDKGATVSSISSMLEDLYHFVLLGDGR